jgi:hypothetical protein
MKMSSGARSPISDKILVSKEESKEEEAGGGDAMAVRMKPLFKKWVWQEDDGNRQVTDEELSG